MVDDFRKWINFVGSSASRLDMRVLVFVLRISLKWKVVDYFQLMGESRFVKNDIPRDNMERESMAYSLYPLIPGEKPRK